MKSIYEINLRFELTWEQMNHTIEQQLAHPTERAIRKIKRCLKWALAYSELQRQCLPMLHQSHKYPLAIMKWFWVDYGEQYFDTDQPPAYRDFMEWYCDTATIQEEIGHVIGQRP